MSKFNSTMVCSFSDPSSYDAAYMVKQLNSLFLHRATKRSSWNRFEKTKNVDDRLLRMTWMERHAPVELGSMEDTRRAIDKYAVSR